MKVNSVYPVPPENAWNVDPRLVEALVTLIKEEVPEVRRVIVADDSAAVKQVPEVDSVDVMETNGIAQAARNAGAEVRCLDMMRTLELPFRTRAPFPILSIQS